MLSGTHPSKYKIDTDLKWLWDFQMPKIDQQYAMVQIFLQGQGKQAKLKGSENQLNCQICHVSSTFQL